MNWHSKRFVICSACSDHLVCTCLGRLIFWCLHQERYSGFHNKLKKFLTSDQHLKTPNLFLVTFDGVTICHLLNFIMARHLPANGAHHYILMQCSAAEHPPPPPTTTTHTTLTHTHTHTHFPTVTVTCCLRQCRSCGVTDSLPENLDRGMSAVDRDYPQTTIGDRCLRG